MNNNKPFESLIKLFDSPKLKISGRNEVSYGMQPNLVPISVQAQSADSLETHHSSLPDTKTKKEKWNAYMRQYNAKKKQELKERLNKVPLIMNNCEKLYDVKEIKELIINF